MFFDKQPTKAGQYVSLSTTGWHICWARAGQAWGLAGQGQSKCSAGATSSSTMREPWAKATTFSFQGQTSKQIGRSKFKPKFYAQIFSNQPVNYFFFIFVWSSCPSPCCPIGVINFLAALYYCSLLSLTCNLVCPRPLWTRQDNSAKDASKLCKVISVGKLNLFSLL